MENANLEGTTPMEEQSTVTADAKEAPKEKEAENSGNDNNEAANGPFLCVRFNHEAREMTKEQAVEFAQKGLMYDKISPIYHKLDYLAAIKGKDAGALVDGLLSDEEQVYRGSLIEKFGEDGQLIEDLMTLYRGRNREKYEKMQKDEARGKSENALAQREERLTKQFRALQKEFPEIQSLNDLPKEVVQLANGGEGDLTAAYLLYCHRQEKRIARANKQAAEQSNQTTGSVNSNDNTDAAAFDAFIRGLKTR